MPPDVPSARLSPDEVGEVLRRAGVSGARFDGRPTVDQVAERAGMAPEEVHAIVSKLRSLGAAIDAPSGDLEEIRAQAQEYEELEEDPRALARVSEDYTGVRMEGGAGKLPRATKIVLIVALLVFFALLIFALTRTPTPPVRNA